MGFLGSSLVPFKHPMDLQDGNGSGCMRAKLKLNISGGAARGAHKWRNYHPLLRRGGGKGRMYRTLQFCIDFGCLLGRLYRELIMPPGVMSLVSHFGLLANEERGQRSKWLTSYYVKFSWILGSTWGGWNDPVPIWGEQFSCWFFPPTDGMRLFCDDNRASRADRVSRADKTTWSDGL